LQVLENAEGALEAAGGAAQSLNSLRVLGVSAVRKVQASHIHAEAHEVEDGFFGVAGGPDGTNDFGAADAGGFLC
jgi:hypothetical protein